MFFIKIFLWFKGLFASSGSTTSASTGGWWRYIGAMAVSGALCGLIVYAVMDWRLDDKTEKLMLANGNLDLANQRANNAKADIDMCRTATAAQNQAIEALQALTEAAEAAMTTANQARQTAEQRATDILRERTPAGADKCQAARASFADELRKERGK